MLLFGYFHLARKAPKKRKKKTEAKKKSGGRGVGGALVSGVSVAQISVGVCFRRRCSLAVYTTVDKRRKERV